MLHYYTILFSKHYLAVCSLHYLPEFPKFVQCLWPLGKQQQAFYTVLHVHYRASILYSMCKATCMEADGNFQ